MTFFRFWKHATELYSERRFRVAEQQVQNVRNRWTRRIRYYVMATFWVKQQCWMSRTRSCHDGGHNKIAHIFVAVTRECVLSLDQTQAIRSGICPSVVPKHCRRRRNHHHDQMPTNWRITCFSRSRIRNRLKMRQRHLASDVSGESTICTRPTDRRRPVIRTWEAGWGRGDPATHPAVDPRTGLHVKFLDIVLHQCVQPVPVWHPVHPRMRTTSVSASAHAP